ncbi:MAG: efflux RND transporter periplasmic adaptor subunit [Balneolaceae bacterium]|nr:efflux RND transporter periplasmic adaptor subunit [Balneolaceae bacterium]MCH8549661.1 efflux RND transporter periplasmic adaptor subunit [Balneolaceae bacterium]
MKKILFSSGAILSLLLVISCGSDNSDQRQGQWPGGQRGGQATSVEVVPVQAEAISEQVRSYGTIRARDMVTITPQISNRVVRIHVDLGDNVTQGQLMAELYDTPYRDAMEQAQAQIRQARATLERDSTQFARQQQLYDRELISSSEFDEFRTNYLNSRSQYESARASLTQSREDLENTRIKSPVDGVILNRMISEGDVASTGTAIFEVANLVGFETRVFLPMSDWERVQVGQEVSMSLSSRSSEIATGVVSRKSPQLNASSGLGEVVVTLTEAASSVHQGALVQSRINLETREGVVVIPRSAMVEKVDTYIEPETGTIELERTYSAFVNQGDSIAVRRTLTLGIQQGDRIEIRDGLEPGEGLIVTGHRNLEDGARIRVAGSERNRPENISGEQIEQMRQQRGGQGGGRSSSN